MTGLKLAVVAMVCGLFVCAVGCGKRADRAGKEDPALAELRKLGQVQKSGCQDDLNDIFFISPATLPPGAAAPSNGVARVGFAVGKANTILKTTDGGATWRRVMSRNTEEGAPDFHAVMFGSARDGWAVSRGVLLHTSDGGVTWTPVTALPGKFYYFGPSSVTAAHYYQMQPPTCGATVWRTATGGTTWDALPAGLPRNDYGAVFFLNESLGWVAGNYGHFALTQDGGKTWLVKNVPGRSNFQQIQFVNPTKGWLRSLYVSEGGVMTTDDGGQTWKNCPTGLANHYEIRDMQFLNEKTGFLLVHVRKGKHQVLRTLDGGSGWTTVAELPAELTAGCFMSPTEGWVVGSKGLILRLKFTDNP